MGTHIRVLLLKEGEENRHEVPAYQQAFQIAFPVITNIDPVVQAWKEGKPQADVEKLTQWALGKEGVDLWQMLYAKPVDKLPLQMPIEQIETFFPQ